MKSFKNRSYVLTVNISTVIKAGFICILTFIIMFSLSGIISSLKPGYQVNSTIIHKATKNISSKLLFQFLAADTQMINASISSREKPPSIFTILL
ncbi:hypothetical protein ACFUCO_17475, partial [Heyndrickxia sporothermodurans]